MPICVRSAFTLIELLVVIAILSLLVSILLPSLQKAKIMARGAYCKSNLKGIAVWAHMYATEWHGVLPANAPEKPPDDWDGSRVWRYGYYKFGVVDVGYFQRSPDYIPLDEGNYGGSGNRRNPIQTLFHCPEAIGAMPARPWSEATYDYMLNHYTGGTKGVGTTTPSHLELRSTLLRADTWWFADSSLYSIYADGRANLDATGICDPQTEDEVAEGDGDIPWMWDGRYDLQGHMYDSANFAYGDGHVDSLVVDEVLDMNTAPYYPGQPAKNKNDELDRFCGSLWGE